HASHLNEASRDDRARRARDADLLDDRRAVVDDGVDTSDLYQEAQANDEDAGLTEASLEELGEAPLLLVAKVVLDPLDFLFGVHVGFDPAQEVGRLLAPAVHQKPAGGVWQTHDEDQHDNGRGGWEGEDETPALCAHQGPLAPYGVGDAPCEERPEQLTEHHG